MYRFPSRIRKGAAEPVHAPLFLALLTVQDRLTICRSPRPNPGILVYPCPRRDES
jgi:hypothetical protein